MNNIGDFMKNVNKDMQRAREMSFLDLLKLFLYMTIKVGFGLLIYWFVKMF